MSESLNESGVFDDPPEPVCDAVCDNPPITGTDAPDAPHASDPNRTARGRFLPRNSVAVMTALRAGRAHLPEVFAVLEEKAGAFLRASLVDDGGDSEIPARRRAQHEYRAVLHLQILRLNAALETHGVFDRRGKLRGLWLQRLESLINTARQLDASLGLDRRARDLSVLSPAEWVARQEISQTSQAVTGEAIGQANDSREGGER